MKITFRVFPLVVVAALLTHGQISAQVVPSGLSSSYSIVSRGPNERVWARINLETNALGEVITNISSYKDIATGMHYWASNQWNESQELIQSYPDGAIAQYGPHKVIFANNLNTTGAIALQTPDGKELRSRILGLSYFDASSGQSVLIAATTNSLGILVSNNEVVYPNAFDDVAADVQIVYTRAGLEQNVVVRTSLPSPAGFGLSPATTKLQVLTEFFSPPTPAITSTVQADGGVDQALNFGAMQIGKGRAFSIGNGSETNELIAVRKQWLVLDGRTFLVEEVPFGQVEQQIENLGTQGGGASLEQNRRGHGVNVIAALKDVLPKQGAIRQPSPMQLAQLETQPRPGFVLDYFILSSQSGFTFQGDTTYFVSGLVNLSGTTRIEGGSISKYTNSTSAKISISGTVTCQSGQYRPAVFTSMDDDSVGETISGSTGTPTNHFAGGLAINTSGNTLHDLRLSHLISGVGVGFDSGQISLANMQFVSCLYPINASGEDTDTINVDNALFYSSYYVVKGGQGLNVEFRQVTVHCCNRVGYTGFGSSTGDLYLTNCLVVAATNGWGQFTSSPGSVTTNCTAYFTSDPAGIFQAYGAASHYLYDDTYRNKGATDIPTGLLADLQKRTTYPPYEITTNITGDTVLTPREIQDAGNPDYGYHYDVLDYAVSGRTVWTNLQLQCGVALGTYGGSGLLLYVNGNLLSAGTADELNWIVHYNTVQEQSRTNWSSSAAGTSVERDLVSAGINAKFTGWSLLGGGGYHFYDSAGYSGSTPVPSFSHCSFGGGIFRVHSNDGLVPHSGAVALTNCLWERVTVLLEDEEDGPEWYLFNNLFFGGELYCDAEEGSPALSAYDNLFDRTAITDAADSAADFNGYVTGEDRLSPNGDNDVILTDTPVFESGNRGNYYYPTDDGILSTLIDAGSRAVEDAGLGGFTVQTNEAPDHCKVDIGFHYRGASGDLNVSTDHTAFDLASLLVPGVQIANATFDETSTVARGTFTNGFLVGLPIDYGVILSSGNINNAIGPNNDEGSAASGLGQPGDANLSAIVGDGPTLDAAVLEFDIVTNSSFTLQFQYIFASEEYPEWIGASPPNGFNDPMAIFVSTDHDESGWIIATTDDIALVPGTTDVNVSINTINGGGINEGSTDLVLPTNPQYYVDNHDPYHSAVLPYAAACPVYNLQYDGFTTLLTAQISISANVTNQIKIAIADYAGMYGDDDLYDSAVFIKARSTCQSQ